MNVQVNLFLNIFSLPVISATMNIRKFLTFPCPCTKWWLIIFLLSPLIAVRNSLFYFRNYYRNHKNAPTRRRIIFKVMTSLYDHHFRFVHNGVVGDNRWRQASEF